MAAPDAQQLFLNAQAAAQLAVLPTFSNVYKDDNFTATQWLQKVLNHKTGAGWTDEQTITHVRNPFRVEVGNISSISRLMKKITTIAIEMTLSNDGI